MALFRRVPSEPARVTTNRMTLDEVQRATNTASVTAFAEELCEGTTWSVRRVRRTRVRLEPPLAYWATYHVRVERPRKGSAESERRSLVLVARACFASDDWVEYRDSLLEAFEGMACEPLTGLGYPVVFDETQHARWFYPVDPGLPNLAASNDPREVRRLLAPRYSPKTPPARITVETLRYLPEISAALRYTIRDKPGATERTVYGKVYRDGAGAALHETMQNVWELAELHPDLLRVVQPLAYDEDLDLHLELAAPGEPVEGTRTDPRFLAAAIAAAEALAVLHDSGLHSDAVLEIEPELERLDEVVEQFMLVNPPAHVLLRQLMAQLRKALARIPPEAEVTTHGDMKYDQFLEQDGRFTLVDFEDVGRSETSWDLGKWCAHATPSMPETWEESNAAEQARRAFLDRYVELRPAATRQRFPIYEAVHLANRAMVLMWGQFAGWEEAAESLLALANERLGQPAP